MNKLYRLSLVVLLVAIIFLVWDGCSKDAQLSAYKRQVSKFKSKEQYFEQKIDKDKKIIAEQTQIILSKEDAIDEGLLMLNDFKKVDAQVKLVTKTIFDSIYVPYEKKDTIYLTNSFAFADEFFGIYGTSKKDGIIFDSVYFKNDLVLTIGNKSRGFFKKSEPIVEVKYNNPYTTTNSMNNVIIKNDLKWYDRKRTWLGIGMGIGLIGTYLILK